MGREDGERKLEREWKREKKRQGERGLFRRGEARAERSRHGGTTQENML